MINYYGLLSLFSVLYLIGLFPIVMCPTHRIPYIIKYYNTRQREIRNVINSKIKFTSIIRLFKILIKYNLIKMKKHIFFTLMT